MTQLLMLMGLGVKNGEQVEITISGEDANLIRSTLRSVPDK